MMITRRTAAAALTAASYSRVLGANDRVQVGFIGYGLIGGRHVHDFKNQPDVDLAAMSDCYQPRLEQGVAATGQKAKPYRDFRKLLDDKSIQSVVISTPDHWHALMTIMACAAGKDVYVEKPMTLFVREGQWMMAAAKKYGRVVQVGTQQRSGRHYQQARELIRAGHIGQVHHARAGSFRNVMPGFGAPPDGAAPSDFDYDMWLGPAPKRPYNPKRGIYHFRWFWDYSGGQMTNLGAHEIDIMHWFLDLKGPRSVSSTGGRYALEDNGETPDTQDAIFDYGPTPYAPKGVSTLYSFHEAAQGRRTNGGLEFFGTKGSLIVNRARFEVLPDMKIDPTNAIPTFTGQPVGGPQRSETKPEPWTQAMTVTGSSDEQFDLHVRNFLECIKSRQQPVASVESGHQVATACHLANLSLRLRRGLRWDADRNQILGDSEAAAMLERPYRKPWDDLRRSLI